MPSLRNLSPTLHASAALHVGAVVALAAGVQWPWAAAAVLTNHALLTGIGLWPRSTLLGPNMLRLSAAQQDSRQVAITIDDGPNPQVTPAVLDILDSWQAKASFFCIGKAVQTYPELAREIVRRGHRVENHSYSHRHYFSLMGIGTLRNEISQAQDVISQITGQKPVYFRAPAGLRSPLLDPILRDLGLTLATWTRRGFDTVTEDPHTVLQRLTYKLSAGDILLVHDGHCAHTLQGQPVVLDVLPQLLGMMQHQGLSAVALSHAA
jgi:peptidoglycan-N-acetylglucosamine deacetylase